MRRFLHHFFRDVVYRVGRFAGMDRQAVLMGQVRASQINELDRLGRLSDAEFSVFSQWGEDGIISWLVDRTGIERSSFVEFGVEDYRESNTRYLLSTRYWSGLVIDGSARNIESILGDDVSWRFDLKTVQSFITRENISNTLDEHGFGGALGLLSVDIDGVDYWVLEAIENDCDIVVVEYNDSFGSSPVTVPYDASFSRLQKHFSGMYWGASLAAFQHLLERRGYLFVGSNLAGTNAFFVAERHRSVMERSLEEFRAWPCRMREVRTPSGALAHATYQEARELVSELPVVDVTTGETIRIGDLP